MIAWVVSIILTAESSVPLVKPCVILSHVDEIQCAQEDAVAADNVMNQQWRLTLQAMRDLEREGSLRTDHLDAVADLLKAQRAWLAFSAAECVSESDQANGGTDGPLLMAQCDARMARERTQQLRELADRP